MVSILRKIPTPQDVPIDDAPEWLQTMVQHIVTENIPHEYKDDKHWGQQDKRFDGLRVRREGLQIKTKRRWKEVNHGTWRKYEITQVDPARNLRARIENVHDAGNGKVGFDFSLVTKLHAFARVARWRKGVQIFSLSTDADADVQMLIRCEVGMRLDLTKIPPDVILQPTVTHADLQVVDFDVRKISKVQGSVAHELGRALHGVLLRKIDEKQEKLPEKINRQIAKNDDKLRFSISKLATEKWHALTGSADDAEASRQSLELPTAGADPVAAGPILSGPENLEPDDILE